MSATARRAAEGIAESEDTWGLLEIAEGLLERAQIRCEQAAEKAGNRAGNAEAVKQIDAARVAVTRAQMALVGSRVGSEER